MVVASERSLGREGSDFAHRKWEWFHGTQKYYETKPLKNDGWTMSSFLGLPIFRGYIKFPGCMSFGGDTHTHTVTHHLRIHDWSVLNSSKKWWQTIFFAILFFWNFCLLFLGFICWTYRQLWMTVESEGLATSGDRYWVKQNNWMNSLKLTVGFWKQSFWPEGKFPSLNINHLFLGALAVGFKEGSLLFFILLLTYC